MTVPLVTRYSTGSAVLLSLLVGTLAAESPRYIGIRVTAVPPEVRAQVPTLVAPNGGVLVTHVVPESSADRAGLRRYDVLTNLDGTALAGPDRLDDALARAKIGESLPLSIVRGGRSVTADVEIEARPADAETNTETSEIERAALPYANRRSADQRQSGNGISLASGEMGDRVILVTTTDGRAFRVRVEAAGRTWTWTTTSEGKPPESLPTSHRERVTRLIEGAEAERARGVLRFRVQPRADGDDRSVVLLVQQPGADGEYRVLEVQHGVPGKALPVDRLLALDALEGEFDRLAPEVRTKLEAALRRYRIPTVRARVVPPR